MSFPSGSITTTNLDSASDKPKDARVNLLDCVQKVNSIIASFNANSGICGLNASGKVDSSKLTGQVDTAQLASEAVETAKVKPLNITNDLIANTTITKGKLNFISEDTTMGGSSRSHDVVSTQKAVKDYVDGQISATDNTSVFGSMNNISTSGTASVDGFITCGTQALVEDVGRYTHRRPCSIELRVAGVVVGTSVFDNNGDWSDNTWQATVTAPIASGEAWQIIHKRGTFSGASWIGMETVTSNVHRKFRASYTT